MLSVPPHGLVTVCRDSPARECLAWHIIPRGIKVRYRKREDGADDLNSVRMLCPAHNDREPSLSISVDGDRIKWQCFACGPGATARVRLALIREYRIDPGCLPLPAKEKQDILDRLTEILGAEKTDHAEKVLRAMAALEGYADLPRGAELARIASRAGVGLASAYRARKAGPDFKTANHSSYPSPENPVKPRRSER